MSCYSLSLAEASAADAGLFIADYYSRTLVGSQLVWAPGLACEAPSAAWGK